MGSTVIVNHLTVVHKDSGGVSVAFPDVCKTPTPGGPVPMPYPNTARSADSASCSRTVTADGNPMMLKSSHFSMSTGDEAGSAMGLASNKIKGKAYPRMYSFDVKVEGQNVFRLTDIMLQNGGSPTNTPPASELQSNTAAMGPAAKEVKDPEEPEVLKLAWARQEACCGDEATLNVRTKNFPDNRTLPLSIHRAGEPKSIVGSLTATLSGNKDNPRWLTRRGPYKREVKVTGRQTGLQGQETTSKDLLLKAPEPIAKEKVGPRLMRAPAFRKTKIGGKEKWIKEALKFYEWEVCYDIELKQGELVITRLVDFDVRAGAVDHKRTKSVWRRQIEAVWDRKFKIHRTKCKRGKDCNCSSRNGCCSFVIRIKCRWGRGHGKKVILRAGANDPAGRGIPGKWWTTHEWWEAAQGTANSPDTIRPHEFGHLIGMYDEYPEGACEPSRRFYNIKQSVMGAGRGVYIHHMKDFHSWFEKKVKGIIGPTEIRRL